LALNAAMEAFGYEIRPFWRKFNWTRLLFTAVLVDCLLLLAGCTGIWIQEFSAILAVIGPAVAIAVEKLKSAGVNILATVVAAIVAWSDDVATGITQIEALITQYESAEASAQPGILGQITSILTTLSNNLAALLPTIHITDPATQAKVIAIFDIIADEIEGLINLLPTVTEASAMTDHNDALIKVATAAKQFHVLSAKQFKSKLNDEFKPFGKKVA